MRGVMLIVWPCGLMDKALVFGTKDCRFESCQGHFAGHVAGRSRLASFALMFFFFFQSNCKVSARGPARGEHCDEIHTAMRSTARAAAGSAPLPAPSQLHLPRDVHQGQLPATQLRAGGGEESVGSRAWATYPCGGISWRTLGRRSGQSSAPAAFLRRPSRQNSGHPGSSHGHLIYGRLRFILTYLPKSLTHLVILHFPLSFLILAARPSKQPESSGQCTLCATRAQRLRGGDQVSRQPPQEGHTRI